MQEEEVIVSWKGVLVDFGLGRPWKRGLCAALVVGLGAYALGPKRKRDGRIDPTFFYAPVVAGFLCASLT